MVAVDELDEAEDPDDDELDDDVELDPDEELGPAVVEVGDVVLALSIGADGDPPHPASVAVARAVTRVTKQIFTRNSPALILEVRESAGHMREHAGAKHLLTSELF